MKISIPKTDKITKFIKNPFTFSLSRLIPKTDKIASSPGTIKYIGKKRNSKIKISLINYNENEANEIQIKSTKELNNYDTQKTIKWINIKGVHNEKIIHEIGEIYKIHPLVLEDIANTTQRPKIEEYNDYTFIVLKIINFSKDNHEVLIEQFSILVGKNYVITFDENEYDDFSGVKARILSKKGKITKLGSDYLMYAIIDAVVDQYFTVLEEISEKMEELEDELMFSANQNLLNKIYSLKKEIVYLKKSIWPLREVINSLQRSENKLITKNTLIYLRDVYDHTIHAIETVETFRDLTSGMLDLYLSTVSNKTNEIMKVLTIFSAIFIPLTFLAGVYGMNFQFMPELAMKWTYPAWWIFCIIVTIILIIVFKKKKWL
ncbi:MAG: magnesium/cobalt transporter CorA [Candidatus Gracilibacteria bacterium]|nr:magnesium/cobalt transporter CorA [Candidatus Gracilibacteria bacterium]